MKRGIVNGDGVFCVCLRRKISVVVFFFKEEDGIRDGTVTGVQTCALPIYQRHLKMHVVAISEVVGRTVLLVGVLIATVYGWGLVPVVLIVSVGGIANFLVNFLVAKRYADF